MDNIINLDNQISMYLDILNERQKKALLTVAKTFADELNEPSHNYTDEFIAELDRRTSSLENGTVKGVEWDEVKRRAQLAVKIKGK